MPIDVPWRELTRRAARVGHRRRRLVAAAQVVRRERFFAWLESKAYKMHVRVLLSKYRCYDACPDVRRARASSPSRCSGGSATLDDARCRDRRREARFRAHLPALSDDAFAALPGLSIHDLMMLPVERTLAFFERVELPQPLDDAAELVLGEIRQPACVISATWGSATSRSIGSRARCRAARCSASISRRRSARRSSTRCSCSMSRASACIRATSAASSTCSTKLRDAGNTLLVVEHDAQVMLAADRIIDIGPGPGPRRRRGRVQRLAGGAARGPASR